MRYYFTTSNLIGSRLIRWGLNDTTSHVAVGFGEGDYSIVVQSNLAKGFAPTWLKTFKSKQTIVKCLEYKFKDPKDEMKEYYNMVDILGGKSYDSSGIMFLSALAIGFKLGFIDKEKFDSTENKWADKDSVYCVEIMHAQKIFLKSIGFDVSFLERQNLRPQRAMELLIETGSFKEVECLK